MLEIKQTNGTSPAPWLQPFRAEPEVATTRVVEAEVAKAKVAVAKVAKMQLELAFVLNLEIMAPVVLGENVDSHTRLAVLLMRQPLWQMQ